MKTAKEILGEKHGEIISVKEGTVIFDALEKMNQHRVGALLVKRDDDIVGIWTERDLMRNIIQENFDLKQSCIEDVMTTDLISAPHTDTVYNLMDKFLGLRLRHLLIEEDGKVIGLISSGDVMRCAIAEKDAEFRQLNSMVSWDYYENWKWKP
jgi:signal-transduction protein with cAMP-binding, CBS, and nucleotidyltransferase domain